MFRSVNDEFVDFVDARGPALLRYAGALTGNPEEAKAITHSVLGQARASWADVVAAGVEDELRSRLAAQALRGGVSAIAGNVDVAELAARVRAAGSSTSQQQAVNDAFEHIPRRWRVALTWRFIDRQPSTTVAARLVDVDAQLRELLMLELPSNPIVSALTASESALSEQVDLVQAVNDLRRSHQRRALRWTAAVAAAVVGLGVLAAVQGDREGPPRLVVSTAPRGQHLLAWPPAGNLLPQTDLLGAAVAAWQRSAPDPLTPTGAVYPLLAQSFDGVPVIILQANSADGIPHLALVGGQRPALVSVEELPVTGDEPVALHVPVVFATGASAIYADGKSDSLLLGPSVSKPGGRLDINGVGWQQVPSVSQNVAPEPQTRTGLWVPLEQLSDGSRLVPLSPLGVGPVEVDVIRGGETQQTAWLLPSEASALMLMTPTPEQVVVDPAVSLWPPAFELTSRWWSKSGRTGPFKAQVLASVDEPFARDLTVGEVARANGTDALLVQSARWRGRSACFGTQALGRGAVDAYPFVVTACRVAAGKSGATTYVHAVGSPQNRRTRVVGEFVDANGDAFGTFYRGRVGQLSAFTVVGTPQRAAGVRVTSVDGWNNLPAYSTTWRFNPQ